MDSKLFLFYCFSLFAILGGCFVITARNPIKAVLSLVFTFFCMAANWLLLEAEFLSIVLILVYVGAVMVLFLFMVMMIHLEAPSKQTFVKHWPFGVLLATAFIAILLLAVSPKYFNAVEMSITPHPENFNNIKVLGELLYTEYLLPFEMAGIILLLAMLAAIGLTYRGPHQSKPQKAGDQVKVRKADRLKIIKMASEKEGS
jgi:NADH-quinone oxidoreductase subunit J